MTGLQLYHSFEFKRDAIASDEIALSDASALINEAAREYVKARLAEYQARQVNTERIIPFMVVSGDLDVRTGNVIALTGPYPDFLGLVSVHVKTSICTGSEQRPALLLRDEMRGRPFSVGTPFYPRYWLAPDGSGPDTSIYLDAGGESLVGAPNTIRFVNTPAPIDIQDDADQLPWPDAVSTGIIEEALRRTHRTFYDMQQQQQDILQQDKYR